MARRRWAADLIHFWFHKLKPAQRFGRDDHVDAELRRRFGRSFSFLRRRRATEFLRDRHDALAAVVLFDQIPRNLFRNHPRAFGADPLAREIAKGAIRRGWFRSLGKAERQFLAMPLMHSECILDQRQSLRFFTRLGDAEVRGFARAHYRMVARFGRFPHRNGILGRESSQNELAAVAAGNAW